MLLYYLNVGVYDELAAGCWGYKNCGWNSAASSFLYRVRTINLKIFLPSIGLRQILFYLQAMNSAANL
jgi:hypothetical protein